MAPMHKQDRQPQPSSSWALRLTPGFAIGTVPKSCWHWVCSPIWGRRTWSFTGMMPNLGLQGSVSLLLLQYFPVCAEARFGLEQIICQGKQSTQCLLEKKRQLLLIVVLSVKRLDSPCVLLLDKSILPQYIKKRKKEMDQRSGRYLQQ